MKFILLCLVFCQQLYAAQIKVEDVSKIVSEKNYVVLQNAQITYQSKETVSFARHNLLPQLNVWDVAGIFFSWTNALGVVQDIAPFLVPANWFRVKEQKILFEAQKYGYHAVWANQIFIGKTQFYRLSFDEKLLQTIRDQILDLNSLYLILKTREMLGQSPLGQSAILSSKISSLKDDEKRLEYLVATTKAELKYILAIPAQEEITILSPALSIEQQFPYDFHAIYGTALEHSPEIKQFKEFIKVIPQIKKEVRFSFLGTSSISRGVGGGIFDDIPVQKGLGFGAGNTMAILRSKEAVMKMQLTGVEETIKNQLRVLVEIYNSDLIYYPQVKSNLEQAEKIYKSYLERLQMGQSLDIWELVDARDQVIQTQMTLNSLAARHFDTKEKIERNLMAKDYSVLPNFEEQLKEVSDAQLNY